MLSVCASEGRAASPQIKISQTDFDFHEVPYNRTLTAEIGLNNTGLVDLDYCLNLSRVSKPWTIEVAKRSGIIRAKERGKVEVFFRASKC